jgi:hypothetical protein
MTPKIFFANLDTPKGTSLGKSASIEALCSRWLLPFDCRVPEEYRKKLINTSGNCIFNVYREQTPLNQLSFLAHRVTSPAEAVVQNFTSIGQGITVGRGSENRTLP